MREAAAAARSSLVPTLLVGLVVGVTCLAALLTVGRQAAAEDALRAQLAGPTARTLTLTVTGKTEAINPPVVDMVAGLRGTDVVLASELPVDAHNGVLGAGSPPVSVVALHGTVDRAIAITQGRMPGAGEVVVSEHTMRVLGLRRPIGFLETREGDQWAIVGSFTPRSPFADLDSMAVTAAETSAQATLAGASFHRLRVVADDVAHVAAVQAATLSIVSPDPSRIQVESALTAATTGREAAATLLGFGRSLLLLILGAGAFFVAAVVLADVLIRRRDLGRRRTLGITRMDLVLLVALRTTLPATVGALVGGAVGCVAVWRSTSYLPVEFAVGVIILATLTALASCLPPAIYAARRDPVAVMRTP